MKVYTEVEVDLCDIEELRPVAENVKNFLDDYKEMSDIKGAEEWLASALEVLKEVSDCLNEKSYC
jgi:hypothetical protein